MTNQDHPLPDYSEKNHAPGAIERAVKDFIDSSGIGEPRETNPEPQKAPKP